MTRFTKEERLCSKKIIEELFSKKNTRQFTHYPILAISKTYAGESVLPAKILFSVPKKKFRKAHERNRIRRQMRESYRNQKGPFYDILSAKHLQCAIVMVYIAQEMLPYKKIEDAVGKILEGVGASV